MAEDNEELVKAYEAVISTLNNKLRLLESILQNQAGVITGIEEIAALMESTREIQTAVCKLEELRK